MPGQAASLAQPRADSVFSLDRMIRGYTLDAAYQLNMETDIGSIEVGKKADLLIMRDNIFELAPQKIHTAKVYQTVLGGELIYQRDDSVKALETELGI
jgi:predicted amidohydrolase YtcJ